MPYIDQFKKLFAQIASNAAFEIQHINDTFEEDESLAEEEMNIFTRYNIDLPDHYIKYLNVSDSISLKYIYSDDDQVLGSGEFALNRLCDTLLSQVDPELWHENMPAEQIELLKTFRVIDDHPQGGDNKLAALSKQGDMANAWEPSIYFYDRGNVFKMNVDYGGYLDGLLGTFAFDNWQYLFCDIDMNLPEYEHIYFKIKSHLDHFSDFFPEHDFDIYYKLLESRR